MKVTFGNDPCLKEGLITKLQEHEELNQFQQARYGTGDLKEDFKGCALGCTLVEWQSEVVDGHEIIYATGLEELYDEDYSEVAADRYGLPNWLTNVEESVFENLPIKEGKYWPRQLIEAIPVGVPFQELEVRVKDILEKKLGDEVFKNYTGYANEIDDGGLFGARPGWLWMKFDNARDTFLGGRLRRQFKQARAVRDEILELLAGVPIEVPQVCEVKEEVKA